MSGLAGVALAVVETVVAGVVSPLVSHTPLGLALAMAAFALAARLVWMWHLHAEKKANTDRP